MTKKVFCSLPFRKMKITSEGDVSMCCFQKRGCLGNILVTPFEEIWKGNLAKEIRNLTENGEMHQACRVNTCPFYHLTHLSATEITKDQESPIDIELDLPNQHCNVGGENPTSENPACLMCERHLWWRPQGDKLKEICEKLLPHMSHVKSVHLQGVAESFWKDRIFDVFDWLGIHPGDDQIVVSTTTNGTLLNEPRRRRFLKYPKSTITFSIDASTPETYKLIRRVDLFHRVKENLLAYSREKSQNQILRIHNNINLLNIKEVIGMVELAAQANCHIEFNPTYDVPGICVADWNAYLFKEAEQEILSAAKGLGASVSFMRNLTLDFDPKQKPNQITVFKDIQKVAEILQIPVKDLVKCIPPNLVVHLANL